MTIEQLAAVPARDRMTEVRKHEAWLDALTQPELDEVGRLLCHGSSKVLRTEHPIIGDLPTKERVAQEAFEARYFGDPAKIDQGLKQDTRRGELPVE